jgi:hypothetical protein
MTNSQAFMMGMTAAVLPSFTVVALLFLRSRISLGPTFIVRQQPAEPATMLRIIRGGRIADDLPYHPSGYRHLALVESGSVVPTQTDKVKAAPSASPR